MLQLVKHIKMAEDDEEYFSPDEEEPFGFNLQDKIIDTNEDGTYIVKLSARDLIYYVTVWCFNREIVDERIDELYQNCISSSQKSINPTWIFHLIYDTKSDANNKLYLLDGQHRREVIRRVLENDIDMNFKKEYYCIVYPIDMCETSNKKKSIELFKKINNNKQFKQEDLPDDFVADIIDNIKTDEKLKNGIKKDEKYETSREPCIHVKELNAFFNRNKDKIQNLTIDDIIINLKKINNKLSLKDYKVLFGNKSQKKQEFHNKAKKIDFFLNLKSSKYPPELWIKFIDDPDKL